MDANWQYGEEGRWWQIVRCNCCRVGDVHSTDVSGLFSLLFIRFFCHPHLSSLAAIVPAWKLWNTPRYHPTSTPLHDTFYVMISVTFECKGQADRLFLLQVDVAGDGSTTTQIKMNTKWLCNTSRSHPTSTPLHDKFYVPFLLQVVVAGDGSTTTKIKMNTKWLSLAAIVPAW